MTAPTPVRPAARCISFMMLEMSERCSPAGPMQATLASSSVSARTRSVVSCVSWPQMAAASRISTLSSLIHR